MSNKLKIIMVLTIFVIFFLQLACEDMVVKPDQEIIEDDNSPMDVTTMVTPRGEKLRAAPDGPVRSALEQPEIDLSTFKLTIDGLVDSANTYSWSDIFELDVTSSDTILMYCVEGWEVWGRWGGISINDLLLKAKPHTEADYILFHSVEGYSTALPISYLLAYNAILAYEVNNEPLLSHDGFPLRLVAFGMFGYKWAKWINRVELISGTQLGYWEKYGYPDVAHVPVGRRAHYEGEAAQPLIY